MRTLVVLFALVMGLLALPPIRNRVERTLYPR